MKMFRAKNVFFGGQKRWLFLYFKWYTGSDGDGMLYQLYDSRESCQEMVDYLNSE